MTTFSINWTTYVSRGTLSEGIKKSCTKTGQGGGLAFLEGEFTYLKYWMKLDEGVGCSSFSLIRLH